MKTNLVVEPSAIAAGESRFGAVGPSVIEAKVVVLEKKAKARNDPRLVVAAARELRDRWLEQLNAGPRRCRAASTR